MGLRTVKIARFAGSAVHPVPHVLIICAQMNESASSWRHKQGHDLVHRHVTYSVNKKAFSLDMSGVSKHVPAELLGICVHQSLPEFLKSLSITGVTALADNAVAQIVSEPRAPPAEVIGERSCHGCLAAANSA